MKRLAAAVFVLIFILVVSIIWWITALAPVNPNSKGAKNFVIAKGDGIREIAKKLHDQGLIRDQIAFFLLVKKMGIEKNIQAGRFKLSPSLSAQEVANKLTLGTEDIWITIPEGWRVEQILEHLQKSNEFWQVSSSTSAQWKKSEGRLFPETYLVPKEASLDKVEQLLLSTFDAKVTSQMKQDGQNEGLTLDQVVIIASMVERESRTNTDRPIVAAVLLKRLRDGHPLQVDATVQYAIGYTTTDGWWKKELTQDDLKFKSPYNTYLTVGLPPGPICNPGLASINAVIHPAQTDYYYYLSDKQGHMHYAKTIDEHNANVAKYL